MLGEQHWSGAHTICDCKHCEPTGHPPLSMAHENSQYGNPVALHTLHVDPLEHSKPVQAVREINKSVNHHKLITISNIIDK